MGPEPRLNGAALRQQFDVPVPHDTAVLVGEDGGEKWRVPAAMLVRQREMRGN